MNRTEGEIESGQTEPKPSTPENTNGFWVRPLVCTGVGLVGNAFLSGGKLLIGFMAGSAALIADGFHSLADVLSDIGIIFAIRAASTPPDEDHPYGHHSFETLGAIVVALFMLITAILIGKNAVSDLIGQKFLNPEMLAFWASLVAVLTKEIMARYTLFAGRLHGNPALLANGAMHRSDAISSLAAAAGIGGSILGWPYLDSVGALVISLLICKMGWDLLKENVMVLMDTMPDKTLVVMIRQSVESVPCVQEVRDLRVRQRGSYYQADLRLAIHPEHTIEAAHNIAHEAENRVKKDNPKVERVFIHVEPGHRDDKHSCPTIDRIETEE